MAEEIGWLPIINGTVLAVITTTLGVGTTLWLTHRRSRAAVVTKLANEQDDRDKRIAELETQLRLVGQSITPITAAMQAIFIKELTHEEEPELDALLLHLGPPSTLTPAMSERLHALLEERSRIASTESERDVAVMLPMLMKRVAVEWDSQPIGAIQSVLLPADTGEHSEPDQSQQ